MPVWKLDGGVDADDADDLPSAAAAAAAIIYSRLILGARERVRAEESQFYALPPQKDKPLDSANYDYWPDNTK
jgi:hypothetical protein